MDALPSKWRVPAACALLVIVTLAVYWPARHYQFVAYDDDNYVYNNPVVLQGLTLHGLQWALVDRQANNWHPLTWVSHMIDCQIFGLNAGGPHMVNVALHCANAVLLFLLLQVLLSRGNAPPPAAGFFWPNLFVAALFALHPLRVESVAWISERKDVLSGFFGLLSLLCYARHITRNGVRTAPTAGSPWFYSLAVLFFGCSLLSKPMLVTLPLVMLLLDFWPLQRFNESTLPRLLKEKWPFFFLAAIFCVITLLAQQPGLPSQRIGLFTRAEIVATNYLGYIEKLLWPENLSFLYLRPDAVPLPLFLLALLVLAGISALAFFCRHRCPAVTVGWLWFLMVLFPTSGVIALGRLSIADRYTYFAGIGFYLMVTWGVAALTAKFPPAPAKKFLPGTAAVIVLAVCALLSRHQLAYWQNTETLYEHALKVDPDNYVARQNLRIYLFEKAHPSIRQPPPE